MKREARLRFTDQDYVQVTETKHGDIEPITKLRVCM